MMLHQFAFEKLEVWQLSRKLTVDIYQTKWFPAEEKYGLTSQVRRAAVAVPANIAEGSTRLTAKDQSHFTTIAYSSLMELLNHLIIAADLGYLNEKELENFRAMIQNLSVKLNNLKIAQLKRMR